MGIVRPGAALILPAEISGGSWIRCAMNFSLDEMMYVNQTTL
ncbi:MAG TPA: hypothetical protein VFB12_09230 [Ktedonobacteraceae bacterium]|nr:hypothetical protein [Ktedonobacteraceae bacterium]